MQQQRHQDTVALVQVQQPVVVRGELGQRAVHGDGGGPVARAARLEEGSHLAYNGTLSTSPCSRANNTAYLETNRGVSVMNVMGRE